MNVYVTVGHTVVGGFRTATGVLNCIKQLAPGCNPKVKKCRPIPTEKRAAKCRSNEARQTTGANRLGDHTHYPRMLQPGDFKL